MGDSTTDVDNPTPQPPTPPTTPPPAENAATAIAAVKSDLHQMAEQAQKEFWSISATARADFQRLLADVENAESVSVASLKRILGV
jgi:hypothetical protein